MIGRLYNVVIDCPDPAALAGFYSQLLGMPVVTSREGWVVISDDQVRIAFQAASDLREPRWPDPERPQQMHLDVMVEDVDAAEAAAIALGAKRLPGDGEDFRVFEDPAGHPFCLVFEV
ncbi:VOC family protein [Asanoa sp. WMMD1127]|uniref:VOC family protein n=1 Tax=Asanoa sp. WMMD1127 TaxID=3016107 RepID=UPI002417D2CE|nr:VOC family protein [Asanoa sp. WMMD1127]MDG4823447.1 VOC family protein [Asanoa sp. WMMD1127]